MENSHAIGEWQTHGQQKAAANLTDSRPLSGVTRRDYLVWLFLFYFLSWVVGYGGKFEPILGIVLGGLSLIALLVVTASRLRNIGLNGYATFLLIVPFANVVVSLCCFCFPQNFWETEKMDKYGWVLLFSYIPFFLILFLISAFIIQ